MSFLTFSEGIPELSKAVISLWFRVPEESIEKISEEYQEWLDEIEAARDAGLPLPPRPRRFLGIIPLMTFGPADLKARAFGYESRVLGIYPPMISHFWVEGPGSPPDDPPNPCKIAEWRDLPVPGEEGGPLNGIIPAFDGTLFPAGDFELDGSYIGIDCMGETPVLSVNIVMPKDNEVTIEGANNYEFTFAQDANWQVGGTGRCGGAPTREPDFCYTTTHVSQNQTSTRKGFAHILAGCCPETFRLLPAGNEGKKGVANLDSAPAFDGLEIVADHWHHLLLSFDLSGKISAEGQHFLTAISGGVSSTTPEAQPPNSEKDRMHSKCKMWLAFDDENIAGEDLSVYAAGKADDPEKANDIGTVNSFHLAASSIFDVDEFNNPISTCRGIDFKRTVRCEPVKYEFTPEKVDASNIGLPAAEAHTDAVRNVEMAELQIFTEVTLNTGEKRNRRAFVNEDGRPVPPNKKALGDPDGEPGSIELLGKEPEIMLHGNTKWINGENTGTLGSTPDGEPNPAGQFTPTGQIDKYKPEPSLHGEDEEESVSRTTMAR